MNGLDFIRAVKALAKERGISEDEIFEYMETALHAAFKKNNNATKYEYKDESIYRNDKKIAKNIRTASFEPATYTVNNVTKNLIKVNLNIGVEKKSYQKQIEYVLKYW